MSRLEELYFEWLLEKIEGESEEGTGYLCSLLQGVTFRRRVDNDINLAVNGAELRKSFFDEVHYENYPLEDVSRILEAETSWLEMLIALADALDYIYDGTIRGRFFEMITNLGLDSLARYAAHRDPRMLALDRELVEVATSDVDNNRFDSDGKGGIFPLKGRNHVDQRTIEIWAQHAAYFLEQVRGPEWTSTRL